MLPRQTIINVGNKVMALTDGFRTRYHWTGHKRGNVAVCNVSDPNYGPLFTVTCATGHSPEVKLLNTSASACASAVAHAIGGTSTMP